MIDQAKSVAQIEGLKQLAQLNGEIAAELKAEVLELRAEVERLTGCLTKANINHEEFERKWYLEQAEVERLREALRGLLPFIEDAETKTLVGDEGCMWAVEIVRAALTNTPNAPKQEQAEPVAWVVALEGRPISMTVPVNQIDKLAAMHNAPLYTTPQGQTALLRQALDVMNYVKGNAHLFPSDKGQLAWAIESIKQHLGEA